jgi:hypothetical protein
MSFAKGIDARKVHYVLLNDRMMVSGSRSTPGWDDLRKEASSYLSVHGLLIGRIDSAFYGNLEVYEVVPPPSGP